MAITSDQLKLYKSTYVNDTVTNGGRISENAITNNAANNLFRNVTNDERIAGIDLYRKFFLKNENPNDLAYTNPTIWISNVSSGEDYFQIASGTDSDYQSAADDYTDWYGSGYLNQNLSSGESSISAVFKQASGLPTGCALKITNGLATADAVMLGDPVWNGLEATITLTEAISASFLKDVSIISAVMELSDLTPSFENWSESCVAGAYDETTYPLTLFNIGTISESWTLTFTSATEFSASGAVVGVIGTGSINSNYAPINGASYYFLLDKDGWSGTLASGDVVTFRTVHAAQGLWMKESVPAGASSQSNNLAEIKLNGESA